MRTKKVFLLITVAVLVTNSLLAQKISYGVKAGLGRSCSFDNTINDSGETTIANDSYQPKLSYSLNLSIKYKHNNLWAVTAEPGFIQKGWNYSNSIPDGRSYRIDINYLNLPVLANFYLNKKLSLSAGPEFAYLLNGKMKSSNEKKKLGIEKDEFGIYQKFVLSGVIGANYELAPKLDFGIRLCGDLGPVFDVYFYDDQGEQMGDRSKHYVRYAQFYMCFKI